MLPGFQESYRYDRKEVRVMSFGDPMHYPAYDQKVTDDKEKYDEPTIGSLTYEHGTHDEWKCPDPAFCLTNEGVPSKDL